MWGETHRCVRLGDEGGGTHRCGAGISGGMRGGTHRCWAQMWGWGDVGQTHRCVGLRAVGLDPQMWGWELWGRPVDVG